MNKIVWIVVGLWIIRSIWSAVKKAIVEARRELAAQKAKEGAAEAQPQPGRASEAKEPARTPARPQPGEDPKAALLRMLAAAGVSPTVAKQVENALGDEAAEDATDYDDDAAESATDYDDTPPAKPVVYPMPAPPLVRPLPGPPKVWDLPAPPLVRPLPDPPLVRPLPPPPDAYAMPDDQTSKIVNVAVLADIRKHAPPAPAPRAAVHGLDKNNIHSQALIRDSVILNVLLERHPANPFFLKRR